MRSRNLKLVYIARSLCFCNRTTGFDFTVYVSCVTNRILDIRSLRFGINPEVSTQPVELHT